MDAFLSFTRKSLLLLVVGLGLAGCNMVVMSPSGDIAAQQRDLIVISTILMLIIIVPVIFLTFYFAWRYRQSNTAARYDPEWHHSTALEVVIWTAPLLIIIALGAITWVNTHKLDPYRPLDRIDPPVPLLPEPSRWLLKWWRSTGNGCSSIQIMALPPSTRWQRRLIGRSPLRSRRRR